MATRFETRQGGKFLRAAGKPRGLLVMFRGLRARGILGRFSWRNDAIEQLAQFLHEQLPDVDIYLLDSFGRSAWSWRRPEEISAECVAAIDEVDRQQDYKDIRFFCYSMGAALARKTLIGGWGAQHCGVAFEDDFLPPDTERDWPARVSRIVSVAGYARGWIASPRLGVLTRLAMNFYGFAGHLVQLLQSGDDKTQATPLIFRLRRGAPFIVNTRLQWLGLSRKRKPEDEGTEEAPGLSVVHVMPANDGMVSSVEVIDVEGDEQLKSVHYMTVPDTDHGSVLHFGNELQTLAPRTLSRRKASDLKFTRADYLLSALCGKLANDANRGPFQLAGAVPPDSEGVATPVHYLDDTLASKPDDYVERFVFIVHGIRDTGAWAKKIGAELHRQNDADSPGHMGSSSLRTDTQSYGYFTALPFLLPWVRRQKVEWLMDRYATARALFPKAKISFIGHSNGTYLAAAALRDYEACELDRVALAGSVVREDFDWASLNAVRTRVGQVINYVATGDLVVALFPYGVRKIFGRFFGLGGSGHMGFDSSGVNNIRYAVGGHDAGIAEHVWPKTASFILGGDVPVAEPLDGKHFALQQSPWALATGRASWLILILGAIVILSLGWSLAEPLLRLPAWSPIIALTGWLGQVFGEGAVGTFFSARSQVLQALWQCYGNWPAIVQALSLMAYGWLVRFVLFRF
ncbi:MAG: hypothetical protein LCH46_15115 [Proteobacteria bacterium]|nr:hypothetical protein [Pseudomonadota bacterium]